MFDGYGFNYDIISLSELNFSKLWQKYIKIILNIDVEMYLLESNGYKAFKKGVLYLRWMED